MKTRPFSIVNFYCVKTRDRIGKNLRTGISQHKDDVFQAFSSYAKDEKEVITDFGESHNDETAIKLLKKI